MTALRSGLFGLLTGSSTSSGGFDRHYTGVLTPRGSKGADSYESIAAPAAASLSQVAGGSLAATTLFAKVTLVSPSGETTASSESALAVAANNLLRIASPASAGNATGWNAYVGTAGGAELLQNATPIALGTSWTQPASGLLTGGVSPPAANTTGWDVFDLFVPDPVSSASFTTDPVDTGFNAELRVFLTAMYGLG